MTTGSPSRGFSLKLRSARDVFEPVDDELRRDTLELVVDAGAIVFGFAVEERANRVEAGKVGELIEVDPIALGLDHAVIADDDEIDGKAGGLERGSKLADDRVHFERGCAGFGRVGTELVARMVRLGKIDGDEVRAIGGGQAKQGDGVVDARLLRLRSGLAVVVMRIPRGLKAGDLSFAGDPEKAGRAHSLALGETPQRNAAVPGPVAGGLRIGVGIACTASRDQGNCWRRCQCALDKVR